MEKENKIILYLYMAFIILHPFLEIYYLFTDNFQILGFSISTLIRASLIFILFILCFKNWENKRKYKYLSIFLLINLFYAILHFIVSNNFNVFSVSKTFSLLGELSYLIKMLVPLLFVFISYYVFKKNKVNKLVIIILSVEIIALIIIPSIFGISILSYGGKLEYSKYHIWDWFKQIFINVQYEKIGVKGLFYQANPLGTTLAIIISLVSYYFFKLKKNIFVVIIILLNLCSMMLGTRVGTFIWLIIEIAYILLYSLLVLFKKEKYNIKYVIKCLLILLISGIFFAFSPGLNRNKYKSQTSNIDAITDSGEKSEDITASDKKAVCDLIKNKYNVYGYQLLYFDENYKCENDIEFWLNYGELPFEKKADGREIQSLIIKRVSSLNKASFDEFFGMGQTNLHISKIYLENDILWQYYTMGLFGIIIYLFPYLMIAILGIKNVIKYNKLNLIPLPTTIILVFGISYLSGNSFDSWLCMCIMAMVCGMIIVDFEKELNKDGES